MPRRELIPLADAAAQTQLNVRTLRRYIADGRLTGYRVGPRSIRVDQIELDALSQPIPTVRGAA
jgi:excisionase family DNA binding protein